MLDIFIDNVFGMIGGHVLLQTVGFLMGTNCAPNLADLFIYSCEAGFILSPLQTKEKRLAQSFCFTFRYIDDVLSLNNCKFGDYMLTASFALNALNFESKMQQNQKSLPHTEIYT